MMLRLVSWMHALVRMCSFELDCHTLERRICVAARIVELNVERESLEMQRLNHVSQEERESILDRFFIGGLGRRQYEKERWGSGCAIVLPSSLT